LKKDRHETKDPADYYNVTVSMMVKRNSKDVKTDWKSIDMDGKTLSQAIDKGFPYDEETIQHKADINTSGKLTVK